MPKTNDDQSLHRLEIHRPNNPVSRTLMSRLKHELNSTDEHGSVPGVVAIEIGINREGTHLVTTIVMQKSAKSDIYRRVNVVLDGQLE